MKKGCKAVIDHLPGTIIVWLCKVYQYKLQRSRGKNYE